MDLLGRIDAYAEEAGASLCDHERCGPFTIFHGGAGDLRLYARPTADAVAAITQEDVRRVTARQTELSAPQDLEWIDEVHPELAAAATAAGMIVDHRPLLVHRSGSSDPAAPDGVRIRLVEAGDPALPAIVALLAIGFEASGTAIGPQGPTERDSRSVSTVSLEQRLGEGRQILAVAEDATGPVAAGSHGPRREVTEVTGVATLPSHRRQGLAAAVTVALVSDAQQRGLDLVYLSAASDEVARVYERCGFRRLGHVGSAAMPGSGP